MPLLCPSAVEEQRAGHNILNKNFLILSLIHLQSSDNVLNTVSVAGHTAVSKAKSLPSCSLHSRRRGRQTNFRGINVILVGGVLKKLEWGHELAGD